MQTVKESSMKLSQIIIRKRLRIPFILIAIFIPIAWFIRNPIIITSAPQYISAKITEAMPQYQTSINEVLLYWDREACKPVLVLNKVIVEQDHQLDISLDKASVTLDIEGLISLPPRPPIEIYLDNFSIDLNSALSTSNETYFKQEQIGKYLKKLQILPAASIVLRDAVVKYNNHEAHLHKLKISPGNITRVKLAQSPGQNDIDFKIDWRTKGRMIVKGLICDTTKFSFTADYEGERPSLKASTDTILLTDLYKIWPQFLANKTRSWLINNLLIGSATSSHLELDFMLDKNTGHLQIGDLAANIKVTGATLSYMDGLNKIEDLEALISINNSNIEIKADHAMMQDTPINNLTAIINNVTSDDPELILHGEIEAPVKQTMKIAFAHIKDHKFKSYDIKGVAKNNVDLKIPLGTDQRPEIKVESTLSEVESTDIAEGHEIEHGDFFSTYDGNALTITGKAMIDRELMAKITYNLPTDKNLPTTIELDCTLTPDILKKMSVNPPGFLKKELAFKYIISTQLSEVRKFVEIRLANNINKSAMPFSMLKLGDINGIFRAEVIHNLDSSTTLKDYKLQTPSLSSDGTIVLNNDYSVALIESYKTKFNQAHFSFKYDNHAHEETLEITGERFDLNNIDLNKVISNGGKSAKPFIVRTSLNNLGMYNGLVLNKPEISVDCSPTLCTSAILKGKFESGNNLSLVYKYPDFSLYSDNAGDGLRALNIYHNMQGGLLAATAKIAAEGGVTNGNINISDYHLMKTPILTKLLSITAASSISFGGVADLIKGKGVGFKKLQCPVIYAHNLLILDDCIQEGNVMTMTSKGTLNFANDTMDLSGVVAPVNFVNSLSNKLPLLKQLGGGKKHGGLLAVSYTMKGSFTNDPKIFVNPLSILTPGFLKGVHSKK